MTCSFALLVDNLNGGKISRRQLLALAAAAVAVPGSAVGQDPAARGRGQAPRDTTPLVPPFEPTGWKTVWLDHLSYQCVDYKKAAAFYATLMGWKVRSDDGKQAVLDIGENSGGIIIRGGLTAPPPAAITDAGLGVSRPPVQAVFDGFAWGIEPWDTDKVKAELEKRGLKPVADHHGADYRELPREGSRRVRSRDHQRHEGAAPQDAGEREAAGAGAVRADGLEHALSRSHLVRGARLPPQRGVLPGAPRLGRASRATARRHRCRSATSPARSSAATPPRARPLAAPLAARRPLPRAAAARPANGVTAAIGHISFGIENWNTERVRAELKKRDVVYVNREGQREPRPDMTGTLESFHVPDAMGWDLQIGNKIAPR